MKYFFYWTEKKITFNNCPKTIFFQDWSRKKDKEIFIKRRNARRQKEKKQFNFLFLQTICTQTMPDLSDSSLFELEFRSLKIIQKLLFPCVFLHFLCVGTVCITDLDKLNLVNLMVVWFSARAFFHYCPSYLKNWQLLQKWSKLTQK